MNTCGFEELTPELRGTPLPATEVLSPEKTEELYLSYLEIFNVAQHHTYPGVTTKFDYDSFTTELAWESDKDLQTKLAIRPDNTNGEQLLNITRTITKPTWEGQREVEFRSVLDRNSNHLETVAIEQKYDKDHWGFHPYPYKTYQTVQGESRQLMSELWSIRMRTVDAPEKSPLTGVWAKQVKKLGGLVWGTLAGKH